MTEKEKKKAIRKLRSLLVRVWFVKNWFTIIVLLIVLISAATVAGLIPEGLPVIGTLSNAIKNAFKEILGMNDEDYFSLFGSATGLFSIMFGLGYTTSKIKTVSYSMLDKKKLEKILKGTRLSMNDQGKLVIIESQLGIDLDGDKKIGNVPAELKETNNFLGEVINTTSELFTIAKVKDEVLEKAVEDVSKKETKSEAVKVSTKKPPKYYSPKRP